MAVPWPLADDPDGPLAVLGLTDAERRLLLEAVFGRPERIGQGWRIPLRRALWQSGVAPIDLGPGSPAFWEIPDAGLPAAGG